MAGVGDAAHTGWLGIGLGDGDGTGRGAGIALVGVITEAGAGIVGKRPR